MTRLLRGIGVSPGVACAPAFVVRMDFPEVPDRAVRPDHVDAEVRRLREAVEYVVSHLQELGQRVLHRAGPEESRIFDAQILMAQDEEFLASVETLIRNNQLSAETAYEFKALELRNLWSGAARLRERLADLHAIQLRMLDRLMGGAGHELWSIPADEHVIVASTLDGLAKGLEEEGSLPKIVIYNNNPADNYVFATMAGNFHDRGLAAKVQFGSAWWFLDQKEGIEWQLNALSCAGLLSRFVGMVTDSRSFMSFPRHEYFRRVLCNLIGNEVEAGLLPDNEELIGAMIRNVCYGNAAAHFGLAVGPGSAVAETAKTRV